jgi:hypothetical protein
MYEDPDMRPEYGRHKALEGGGTIAVALLDDIANESPEDRYLEARLVDVLRDYTDLFESLGHVEFRSERSAGDVMSYRVLVWEGGDILYRVVVPLSTVHSRP